MSEIVIQCEEKYFSKLFDKIYDQRCTETEIERYFSNRNKEVLKREEISDTLAKKIKRKKKVKLYFKDNTINLNNHEVVSFHFHFISQYPENSSK